MDDLQAQNASQTEELDRNAFLKLFTTQLQNQDPLDPVKNEAFIAQLAQFSTLEATTSMSDSCSSSLPISAVMASCAVPH